MTYNDRKPTIISASQNGSIYRCLGIWVHRKAQKNRTAQNSAKIVKDSQTDTMLYEVVNHDCLHPRYLSRLCVCVSWTLGTPRFMISFNFSKHLTLVSLNGKKTLSKHILEVDLPAGRWWPSEVHFQIHIGGGRWGGGCVRGVGEILVNEVMHEKIRNAPVSKLSFHIQYHFIYTLED